MHFYLLILTSSPIRHFLREKHHTNTRFHHNEQIENTKQEPIIFFAQKGPNMTADASQISNDSALQQGAHQLNKNTVRFALWAPWKKSVHLIGDFNQWDKQADPMEVNEEGIWSIEKEIQAETCRYQFVIDGETIIGDPYARKIEWVEGSDQPHAIVDLNQEPYAWNDGEFGIRPLNQLVIYELHVGNFSPEGTFQGVTDRLDYIASLGVDAIEIMPIQEFPGDISWGYNPAYFFAPETSYGSIEDFKRLVDSAHQKGIGVILDMVFNHSTGDSPINRLYSYDENPYMSTDGNPWGFPDLNHWNDATKRLIHDIQSYWLTEFHIDGFRYDYAEGIRYDGINGMSFIAWDARQTKAHAYLIAEDFVADPSAVVRDTEIDASWHWQFARMVTAQLREGEYKGYQYGDLVGLSRVLTFSGQGYQDNAQPINYLESHDEERVIYEILTNPALDDAAAIRKSMLGAILLFTAQGVPMLYSGQEFGHKNKKTIDVDKLAWDYLEGDAGKALFNHYATLINLRHQQGALHHNNFEVLVVDHERKLLAFHRWDDAGSVVVVAVNLTGTTQKLTIPFPRAGVWHEWLFDYDEQVGEEPFEAEIPDSFGKIWILQS
jgi:malto-oligosyltrehalose trehalohydrolase